MLCLAMIEDHDRRVWLTRRARAQGHCLIAAESPTQLAMLLQNYDPDALLLSVEQYQDDMLMLADIMRQRDPAIAVGFVAGFSLVPLLANDELGASRHLREFTSLMTTRFAA